MCGRIGYTASPSELVARYPWLRDAPEVAPRYNIAPTDPIIAVNGQLAEVFT